MTKNGAFSDFIDEVRSKNDIVDVIGSYVTLNRRGAGYWACCPFHMEKTPSFSIKQDGQFFKCFGCGESGNVYNFVMKMENVDFITALEILAKKVGMELPTLQDNEEMQRKKKERDKVYQILKISTEFYHNNLINNPNSLQSKYLKTRGITEEMINKFQIGASLNYDDLPKHLENLGYTAQEMIGAGVVGRGENGNLYDFYGTRLLFPIFNSFGDVVAYSGRAVDENSQRAKYKNTPQSIVFNKSEILFGYNFARDLKKEHMLDTLIIVEGHIDVISCHQIGLTNTIGCMGTALTTQHASRIKQLVDNVILCLDGDSAGNMATYKAIDTLKEVGLNVKVVRLVGAKDPDEFIKKYGKDNFINELYSGADCVDFVLKDSATKYDLNSNLEKTKYINEALNYISKLATPAEQEIYLSEVQKIVRVPIEALRKSLKPSESEKPIVKNENVQPKAEVNGKIQKCKLFLLASILYKKITNFDDLQGLFTSNDELSDLYGFIVNKINENKDYNISSLFDNFEIKANSLIDEVINYNFPTNFDEYLKDSIATVKLNQLETEKENLRLQLSKCISLDDQYEVLNKIKDIENQIKEVKKWYK